MPQTRPTSVWTACVLQLAVVLYAVYWWAQLFLVLFRHANRPVEQGLLTAAVERVLLGAAITTPAAAVSLIGLWRGRRWGWVLAVLVNTYICIEGLWSLLNDSRLLLHLPSFVALNLLHFATLFVLLSHPVSEHFLGRTTRPWPLGPVIYYAVAIVSTCVVTAFALALWMGPKNGGPNGFTVFLYFGLPGGLAASFIFTALLTQLARKIDPTRLWPWVLVGGSLAPVLLFALAVIGYHVWPLGLLFSGPVMIVQVWWLGFPVGVVTGWICYELYPRCLAIATSKLLREH